MSTQISPIYSTLPREAVTVAALNKSHVHSSELEVLASSSYSDLHLIITGTCSTKSPNSIHIYQYAEDSNTLEEVQIFDHPLPIHQIITSPYYHDRFLVISANPNEIYPDLSRKNPTIGSTNSHENNNSNNTSNLSSNFVTMYAILPDPDHQETSTITTTKLTPTSDNAEPTKSASLPNLPSPTTIDQYGRNSIIDPTLNKATAILDYGLPIHGACIVPIATFQSPSEISSYFPKKRSQYFAEGVEDSINTSTLPSSSTNMTTSMITPPSRDQNTLGFDYELFQELIPISEGNTGIKSIKEGNCGMKIDSPVSVLWDHDVINDVPSNRICIIYAYGAAIYNILETNQRIDQLRVQYIQLLQNEKQNINNNNNNINTKSSSKTNRRSSITSALSSTFTSNSSTAQASLSSSSTPHIQAQVLTHEIVHQLRSSCPALQPARVTLFDTTFPANPNTACWDISASTPYSHIYVAHGSTVCLWEVDSTKSASLHQNRQYIPSTAATATAAVTGDRIDERTPTRGKVIGVNEPKYVIHNAHHTSVLSLDCNPNKPHHIVTSGEDGDIKIWNTRRKIGVFSPILVLRSHTEPCYNVSFNLTHDQLLITSSGDFTVKLWNTPSVSSIPISTDNSSVSDIQSQNKTGNDRNDRERGDKDRKKSQKFDSSQHDNDSNDFRSANQLLQTYETHQESINQVCWTRRGSWHFFSISQDGRLAVLPVPDTVKYRILL